MHHFRAPWCTRRRPRQPASLPLSRSPETLVLQSACALSRSWTPHTKRPKKRKDSNKNRWVQLTIPSHPEHRTPPPTARRRRSCPLPRCRSALPAGERLAATSPGLSGGGCGPAPQKTPLLRRRADTRCPAPKNKTKRQEKTTTGQME